MAMAQINPTVGDLEGNAAKIIEYIEMARSLKADLVAFTELAVPGYPPEDLLFKPQFIRDNLRYLDKVVKASRGIAVVVGFADEKEGKLYNAAALACDGKLVHVYHKMFLPNYGVFDEKRYFEAGRECPVYTIGGVDVGVNVCEDIWYEVGPTNVQCQAGAELIVNINGSPYHAGKSGYRHEMLAKRAVDNQAVVSYTNMVGGQDELVFDGDSVVFGHDGKLLLRGNQFREELLFVDLDIDAVSRARRDRGSERQQDHEALKAMGEPVRIHVSGYSGDVDRPPIPRRETAELGPVAEVYQALVMGTRDYVTKSGFQKVVVGLSGGIDSSLTAVIAVDALGKENVVGVTMPSRYSSEGSVVDSRLLSENLGIRLMTVPIEPAFGAYLEMLDEPFRDTESGIAEENLQARVRGNILMALSNKFGWLVLTTGNKSELATGYSTMYGDMAGGFAVIKDVPKMLVYELARHVNEAQGKEVVPDSVIEKPPSAELRPDQRDEDSLPPYEALDAILKAYVEEDRTYGEILALGYDEAAVQRAVRLVDGSEYKRRQSPPGVKITPRNFGRDRRMPIVNRYRQY